MSHTIAIPWGGEALEFALPDGWTLLGALAPREEPAPDDVAAACAEALQHPIGAPRLSERDLFHKRVLIVCDDHSRPTPVARFIDPVLGELGLAFVQELAGLTVPEPADIALSSSFPADVDLRQSIKCVGNALYACKPGGLLLGAVYCAEGLGEIPIPRKTLPYPLLRLLVRTISKHRILGLVKHAKQGEPVEEIFVGHFGLQMLRRNHVALFSEGLDADLGRKLGAVRVFDDPQRWIAWARRKAPRDATVWVLPYGGVSYARRTAGA